MIGASSLSTDYQYDADGNRTKLGDLQYSYDYAGRPVTVSHRDCSSCTPVSLITSASYLPFGPEAELVFGNGTRQTKSHDTRYRITQNTLTFGAQTIAAYTYVTDDLGNVTSIHDVTNAGYDRGFSYDDINRLTAANSGTALWGTGAYTYDAMGNLLSATLGDSTKSFTFVGTTPKIATVTEGGQTNPVNYDAVGNELDSVVVPRHGALVTYTSATMATAYSCRNLPALVSTSTLAGRCPPEQLHCHPFSLLTEYDYKYDGRGIRAHLDNVSDGAADYVYTPELQLSSVRRSSGDIAEMAWFNGHAITQISTSQTTPLFTFTDHLGTPLLQTDSAGQVVWRAEYEPYGRVYELRAGSSDADQPLRFPGQDSSDQNLTGADENYNIFRWYRSGWGRYTQADPLGLGAGLNAFSYADDDPLDTLDPLGLSGSSSRKQRCMQAISNIRGSLKHAIHHHDPVHPQSLLEICRQLSHWMPKFNADNCDVYDKTLRQVVNDYQNDFCNGCTVKDKAPSSSWQDKLQRWLDNARKNLPNLPFIPIFPMPQATPEPAIPGVPPFFINPCMMNPSLCYGPGGGA